MTKTKVGKHKVKEIKDKIKTADGTDLTKVQITKEDKTKTGAIKINRTEAGETKGIKEARTGKIKEIKIGIDMETNTKIGGMTKIGTTKTEVGEAKAKVMEMNTQE